MAHPQGAVILDAFKHHATGQTVFTVRFGEHYRSFTSYRSAIAHARKLARREGTTVYDHWHARDIRSPNPVVSTVNSFMRR